MRLCGISSRFQLLSPSTRQVTHALLTRPPLTYISLGFNVSPFDLHVLGTPPAFILSQDQTLNKKFILIVCFINYPSYSKLTFCLVFKDHSHFSMHLLIYQSIISMSTHFLHFFKIFFTYTLIHNFTQQTQRI